MNKYEETLQYMQSIQSQIKERAAEKSRDLDDDHKELITTVSDKTIDIIAQASRKLEETVDKITDQSEMEAFLARVCEKCEAAKEYAYRKFDEIDPIETADYETKEEVPVPAEAAEDKTENTEAKEEFVSSLKKNLFDFFNNEKTKDLIAKAELGVLKIADKSLDILLDILEKKEK